MNDLINELNKYKNDINNYDEYLYKNLTNSNMILNTLNQSNNFLWFKYRNNLITSSKFGAACNLSEYGNQRMIVLEKLKKIKNDNNIMNNNNIKNGILNEYDAIKQYEKIFNIKVNDCGFYIHRYYKFLGKK